MCLSASLFSVSSTLYLLLRPLSSFPSSRTPCEPTERRFNPSPIVKINGFSPLLSLCRVSASISEEGQVNAPLQRSGSLLFPYSRKPASVFLTLAGRWRSSIRVSSICRRVRATCALIQSRLLSVQNIERFSQEIFIGSFSWIYTFCKLIFQFLSY